MSYGEIYENLRSIFNSTYLGDKSFYCNSVYLWALRMEVMKNLIKKDTVLRVLLFVAIVMVLLGLWVLYAMFIWDGK